MNCLHQCGTENILGKTIWATINRSKDRSASEENWCCVSDKIGRASCITNSFHTTRR